MQKNIAILVRDRQDEAVRMAAGMILADDVVHLFVLDRKLAPTEGNTMNVELLKDMDQKVYTNFPGNTTLYACLNHVNRPDIKIITAENPVEYNIDGIVQVPVNPDVKLGEGKKFDIASALRSFMRLDPDVIMVGEIRDRETAEVAITASLTGHLVFSTVHTNDAAGGITRLIDMGIEPFLVASSLVGLLAQRLVRRPCYECARPVRPSEEMLRELGLDAPTFFAGGYDFPSVKGRARRARFLQ